MEKILSNITGLTGYLFTLKNTIISVFSPFIFGIFIAYFINPAVRIIENKILVHILPQKKHHKIKRSFSILASYTVVIGFCVWLSIFFIPDIIDSIATFMNNLPANLIKLETYLYNVLQEYEFIDETKIIELIGIYYDKFIGLSNDLPAVIATILDRTFIAASTLVKVIMGIFISFYMLYEKENFNVNFKKMVYAYSADRKADRFFFNCNRVNRIFENFIIGKALDSLIIGILCFIVTTIFSMPYAGLISLIVGLTNMIPYFGPFIGGIPAVLIILLTAPQKAVLMLIIIIVLQQFDGNYLGPKILGASIGVNPLWIILSIVVGGAIGGPLGMFLGVPIFASIRLFIVESIDNKYTKKYSFNSIEYKKDDQTP
ncbi:MAG: AI-2E family transporter [Anaerotignaceae bacterium]